MSAPNRSEFTLQRAVLRTRLVGMLLLLIGVGTILALIGCGSPRQRYQTLSTFFDGVPDPDATSRIRNDDAGRPVIATAARIVSQHKPFLDNQCAACHNSSSGDIQDFALAYDACVKCHKKVATEHPLMHGPVAREQCKWCHAPHQSTEPALLKDAPIAVCTQCHDKQLLSNNPPEHIDGKTSCLQCHFGHGGPARYFFKPGGSPATAQSTQPSTAPAPEEPLALPRKEPSP